MTECTKDSFAYPNHCECEQCDKNRASSSNDGLCDKRNELIKRLDDYIEFAKGCRNFSNLAFYKELQDYIKST